MTGFGAKLARHDRLELPRTPDWRQIVMEFRAKGVSSEMLAAEASINVNTLYTLVARKTHTKRHGQGPRWGTARGLLQAAYAYLDDEALQRCGLKPLIPAGIELRRAIAP